LLVGGSLNRGENTKKGIRGGGRNSIAFLGSRKEWDMGGGGKVNGWGLGKRAIAGVAGEEKIKTQEMKRKKSKREKEPGGGRGSGGK